MRDKLAFLSVETAVIFLRNLFESFENDKIIVLSAKGYIRLTAGELPLHYDKDTPVSHIRTVYFYGGPMQATQYKGDLLTFLIDRALLISCEKGIEFVDSVVAYAKGFTSIKPQTIAEEAVSAFVKHMEAAVDAHARGC